MIAMKFTIELDIGLSFLLQAALPQLVTDREKKTHRRGRSKRSYGHCRRRTEIPEAERQPAISGCRGRRTYGLRKRIPLRDDQGGGQVAVTCSADPWPIGTHSHRR